MKDIGKHFIVGVSGVSLTLEERKLWKKLKPLGVILFKRNVEQSEFWRDKLKELINELAQLTERPTFVVSIDHEGGRVHRLIEPVTKFPAAKNWKDHSYLVGVAMGKELSSLGINLNFAPSLDVLTEPKNNVIGERAFDSDPEAVSSRALKFLEGLESQGVFGCAKHFPGHGGTLEDSHLELPTVDFCKELLLQRELLPFKEYIKSGRELIMTAHVIFKDLDPNLPATLSKKILTGLLREELGFKGAIITDALDMGALSGLKENDVAEAFIQAGGDLFCVCQDTKDKNSSGITVSPIESAMLYAQSLESNYGLESSLKRSAICIDRFLTKLNSIRKNSYINLTHSDSISHQELADLILTKANV